MTRLSARRRVRGSRLRRNVRLSVSPKEQGQGEQADRLQLHRLALHERRERKEAFEGEHGTAPARRVGFRIVSDWHLKHKIMKKPDPETVLQACIEDLLEQGVSPLAIVEAMININARLIRTAEKYFEQQTGEKF